MIKVKSVVAWGGGRERFPPKTMREFSGVMEMFYILRGMLVVVVQSLSRFQFFSDPMDCSPPVSSVHGISQAGKLEWVAISSSRGSSQPRDWTHVSCLAGGFFTTESSISQVALEVKDPPANAGDIRDVGSIPGLGRSPGEGNGNPPTFLSEESHGQRSLVGGSPVGCKELDTTEATSHTCTPAYRHYGLSWWLSGKESAYQCRRSHMLQSNQARAVQLLSLCIGLVLCNERNHCDEEPPLTKTRESPTCSDEDSAQP